LLEVSLLLCNTQRSSTDSSIAGTTACTLAGRLSAADSSLSILLIEGGKNNKDDPTIRNPAIYLSHLAPDSKTAIFYKGQASKDLAGREPIVPCGGVLGGGSSINFMMYTNGSKNDYDDWNTKGWSTEKLLPLFKKVMGKPARSNL
jgi:alcohol oxidase